MYLCIYRNNDNAIKAATVTRKSRNSNKPPIQGHLSFLKKYGVGDRRPEHVALQWGISMSKDGSHN
jgi:hypothetical protein